MIVMVPGAGVEPARSFLRGILSPLCLPIPPPGQPYFLTYLIKMEAGVGIEPVRYFYRGILSPLCLPISPPGLQERWSFAMQR